MKNININEDFKLSYISNSDNPWNIYLEQINRVEPFLYDFKKWVNILKYPKRVLIVNVPIMLDNGDIVNFEGYRVQHNISRGPGKGGIRYHKDVNISEIMGLAAWMTIKNSVINIPYGGAKGGIRIDPSLYSSAELQRLTRRYTSEIESIIGPNIDIPAPDINTNPQIMSWMMDTYCVNKGNISGVVTGKPVILGGSLGRVEATGMGIFIIGCYVSEKLNLNIKILKIAIQGFGNVGSTVAKLFYDFGVKIVAIQDCYSTIINENGINILKLIKYFKKHNSISGFSGSLSEKDNTKFWSVKCDIIIPAAIEKQITVKNANLIKAKIILEGANGPTTPEADDILESNNILVVPDVIVNSGGVIVSYFEWVQNFSNFFWTKEDVYRKLTYIIKNAFDFIWNIFIEKRISLRMSSFILACRRILEVQKIRGLYP